MATSRALVDTNVLVYALFPSAPQHAASRALVESARAPDAGLVVFPQMLAEFFAVVTNPRRVSPEKSVADALSAVEQFLALPGLALLPVPVDVVSRWVQLVRAKPVTGGDVFDYQAAAAMLSSGIPTIYTYNATDFSGIHGVTALEPPSPAAASPPAP